jgi:hypothetical protein
MGSDPTNAPIVEDGTLDTDQNTAVIAGGFVLLARKTLNRFWRRPPFHLKLWAYLLLKTSHQPIEIRGVTVQRGQLLTSLKSLCAATGYWVGGRPEKPSVPQMSRALKSFREDAMIATEPKGRKLLITVLNYEYYQDPNNYAGDERTQGLSARDILLAKERRKRSRDEQERSLVELIEHYWSLVQMGLEEAQKRHREKMARMVTAGDLPPDAMNTLEEIVRLRKEHQL